MRASRRSANQRGITGAARLLTALAALALLMLPVEYRAGAEAAHPHAAFQLWADFAHGAAPHRHHDDGELHQHAHHVAEADMMGTFADPLGLLEPVGDTTAAGSAVEAPPDVPRLSEATPPAERAAAFAAAVVLFWMVLLAGRPRIAAPVARLVGRSLRPAFPPPRAAVAQT